MKIFLLSFFWIVSSWACDFNVPKVISLSGPVTVSFSELQLDRNPKWKGISTFHPKGDKFKGEIYPGGIFMSPASLDKLEGSIVFFDESRELKRILETRKSITSIEVKTRNLNPKEVMAKVRELISPYVIGCQLEKLSQTMDEKLQKLKSLTQPKKRMLFFLGPIQSARYPEMLMVNDGVVRWLVDEKLMDTYPSQLAYVNWSSKIMQNFKSDLKVGIKDPGMSVEKKFNKKDDIINLTYPGALIPGLSQVDAFIYLFENLKKEN